MLCLRVVFRMTIAFCIMVGLFSSSFIMMPTFGKYQNMKSRLETIRMPGVHPSGGPLKQVIEFQHVALQRQRNTWAQVTTSGLFGLGVPEIVVIVAIAAFVLGPQKIAEFGKDAGKIAGEFKEIPKEFQKGLDEGELEAKARKAKKMEAPESEN